MKKWSILTLLPLLAACSPQSIMTAWHWRDFTAHPDASHYAALKSDLKACGWAGCDALSDVHDDMIDALSAQVSVSNPVALRAGMHFYPLVTDHTLPALRLARRCAVVLDSDPVAFLRAAWDEGVNNGTLATATSADILGNDAAQPNVLKVRRERMAAVVDPDLQAVREVYLTALDKAIFDADRAVPRVPVMLVP